MSYPFRICCFGLSVNGQTTFVIKKYPENTPINDQIYMSGDFEGWTGGQENFQLTYGQGIVFNKFSKV